MVKHISVLEDDPDPRRISRPSEAALRGQKVLLIDDDIELLRLMAARFHAAGAAVEVAVDGQAGLARFMARPADLVVTDLIMPNREGIETIVALKKARPETKIVAISGGYRIGPGDFLTLARHVGADGVLAKPIRLAELLRLAAGLLAPIHHASAA
jgi:DNA-binding response OmpR family regulator